jgi:hypothetical protein
MKILVYGGVEVELQYSWPLHCMEVSFQLHAPAAETVWTLWNREIFLTSAGNRTPVM